MSTRVAGSEKLASTQGRVLGAVGGLLALLVWSYWPTIAELREFWSINDDYSVGQLVPLVALYLVWQQRQRLDWAMFRPSYWGFGLLLLSQFMRFGGIYWGYGSAERLSMVGSISGLILLVGGPAVFRRLIWVQVFLLLMVPLPGRIHNLIALPLQNGATLLGLFGLELLGFYVRQEGNVLHVNDTSTVMVAEACSGLRMLTAFIFTAAVLCFLIRRPVWQKITLLLSSIPVAVATNGLRVLATSVFVYWAQDTAAEQRFHDAAGLLMMPVAVLILVAELKFLAALTRGPSASRSAASRTRQPATN